MALAYSNRSAAHADLGLYLAACKDIEMAFKYGFSEVKTNKLKMRQIECFLGLNKEEGALELLDQLSVDCKDDLTQLKDRINKQILNKKEDDAFNAEIEECNDLPRLIHCNK